MKVQLLVASAGLVLFNALPGALSVEVEQLHGNDAFNSFEYQLADFFSTNANYDKAYIHRGCSVENGAFPVYTTNADCQSIYQTDCAFGDGWYCNDGVDVSKMGPGNFDDAYIHTGCDVGVQYATSPGNGKWFCKDDPPRPQFFGAIDLAYIHPGCSDGAAYVNGAFGSAWYCNDEEDVSGWDPSAFDFAFIHSGCGSGVHYDDNLKAWYCNSQALAGSRMLRGAMTRLSATAAPVED